MQERSRVCSAPGQPGWEQPPHHREKRRFGRFVQPGRKGRASSPQGSNHHMLSCGGSSSELPGKKHLSSSAGTTRVSTARSAQVPELGTGTSSYQHPQMTHHITRLERSEDKSRPGGAARPGHAGKSLQRGGRSRVKRIGADFGAGPG